MQLFRGKTLRGYFIARMLAQGFKHSAERAQKIIRKSLLDRRLLERAYIRQSHSIGRQDTGQRMDVDPLHAKRVGHHAGMLSRRAAKAGQRIFGDVVAALHTDVLNRIGHIFNGDAQKTSGNGFR